MTKWTATFPDGIGKITTKWNVSREQLEKFFADHWPNIEYEILK
jgi:hypothetical protein